MREPGAGPPHILTVAPVALLAPRSDLRVPLVALLVWVILVALIVAPRRPRRPPTDRDDEWYQVVDGPPGEEAAEAASPRPSPAIASLVVTVAATDLPTFAHLAGHTLAATRLDDAIGPVVDRARYSVHPHRVALLLHGGPAEDLRQLVSAVAGEHGVPLLVVQARQLVRSPIDSALADVVAHARTQAPCVLVVTELDALFTRQAPQLRRIASDMHSQLRRLRSGDGLAVVGLVEQVDVVPQSLREDGGFDRAIDIGSLTATERARMIAREAVLHGCELGDDLQTAVRLTAGRTASQLRSAIASAVRSIRAESGGSDEPPTLTARALRAAVTDTGVDTPILCGAFGEPIARRLHTLVRRLHDSTAGPATTLLGASGNGTTAAARWITQRCGRRVLWLTPREVGVLTVDDLDAVVDGATADTPVLVVLDDLDATLRAFDARDRAHAVGAIERLVDSSGAALLATAHDPWIPRWARPLDDRIASHWLRHPTYHERVDLVRPILPHAGRTTVARIAADLAGATRREVVEVARAEARGQAA